MPRSRYASPFLGFLVISAEYLSMAAAESLLAATASPKRAGLFAVTCSAPTARGITNKEDATMRTQR